MEGKIIVPQEVKGTRLDLFLLSQFANFTRAYIKTLIENGSFKVDEKIVKAGLPLKTNMVITYKIEEAKPLDAVAEEVEFDIVFENKNLLVINKPQGLVVHPCSSTKNNTLVNGLLSKVKDLSGINGTLRPGIVHRLDKNTSGLMLVAKNDVAHLSLAKQIQDKTCKRKYLALLEGNLKHEEGEIITQIGRNPKDRKKMAVLQDGGKEAITTYKVVKRYQKFCLVEFSLKTGRTHQIRVHASFLGHPVVGDDIYGKINKSLKGQLLHSYYIEFDEPVSKERLHFEIGLPYYFEKFIERLI